MSIKDLFQPKRALKVLSQKSVEEVASDVESVEYLRLAIQDKKRFFPQVDFSRPGTFSKFGSAEEYFESSIFRIYAQYPYDGSLKEKLQWELSSSYLDLHIFENEYPRTNGYAIFSPSGWGTLQTTVGDYGESNSDEYITLKGGPNKDPNTSETKKIFPSDGGIANIYDTSNNRESNLKFDLRNNGVTIEFWFKQDSFNVADTKKQVIFDLWNGQPSSSADYGRLTLEISGTAASESPFYVTAQSGTAGCFNEQIGSSIAGTGSLETWKHYAFNFTKKITSPFSSNVQVKFYVNGDLNSTQLLGTKGINEVTGDLIANIGALRTSPSGNIFHNQEMEGWGKLSGSIDEFRFWKTSRSSKQIGRYWFSQVGGGTNTDLANTDLGVYYKFNEGITEKSSIDSVVLDYSGRITNGTWTGYTTSSRNTGSAMVLSNAAEREFKDPIIRTNHPTLSDFITSKKLDGKAFDSYNSSQLYKSLPAWVLEEDEEHSANIKKLTQIMSNYFDTLHLQMDLFPHIQDVTYPSGSLTGISRPLPFSKDLLTSRGLITPDIFADATVLEYIGDRDEDREYENDLETIKNTIYKNIYNNLSFIFKSKGTEKSFRNLIRCFGVDDELVKVNMYANEYTYTFENNYKHISRRTNYADFNHPTRFNATVHQYPDSNNVNTVSYISGSKSDYLEQGLAITFETEVLFPKTFDKSSVHFFDPPGLVSSLFGAHTADTSLSDTDTTTATPDVANFQVFSVRRDETSKDVTFKLTGSAGGYFPELTSSIFADTYDNERWLLAVRVAPTKFPNVGQLDGDDDTYTINFYGVNTTFGDVSGEFELTGTIPSSQGLEIVSNPKRFFIGAHRENLTGSVLNKTDVKISNCKVWYDYISNEDLKAHSLDPASFGTSNPSRRAFLHEDNIGKKSISQAETLALHWTFETVTGSDSAGKFLVPDLSSGSVLDENRHGWISKITNRQHSGQGYGFQSNFTSSIDKDFIFSYKQQLPEILSSEDTVNIVNQDDLVFTRENRPQSFFFAIEKSMYQEISYEILKMFSTMKDFNNLIGEPVHRYRQSYKSLEKLRQLYFERVRNTPDFERFVDFYKWFDDSLSDLIRQLVPASAMMSEEIMTVVESHILERNKYWHKFPTLESQQIEPEAGARGINELSYNWKIGHAPVSSRESDNCFWWNQKAEREGVVSSGDAGADSSRGSILSASLQVFNRKLSTPHKLVVGESSVIKSGVSIHHNNKADFFKSEISTLGTPKTITASFDNYFKDCNDDRPETEKTKISLSVEDLSVLDGEAKGEMVLPFSVFSSSANPLFAISTDKEITNLHKDYSNKSYETPLQGPFTQEHVGGLQHRNIGAIDFLANTDNNTINSRPEGFRIRINGSTVYVDGASKGTDGVTNLNLPRAIFFRDETSKRPVNIKNIKSSTSNGILGNYTEDHEIVQTSNRRINNSWFTYSGSAENLETPSVLADLDSFVIGTGSFSSLEATEYTKPQRGKNKHVIVERFSAPGGPETAGDANGGIGLDALSAEYSIYNMMNYRNNIVRTSLNDRSIEHAGQFGTRQGTSISELDYDNTAAFHKVNRNTLRRIELSGSNDTIVTGTVRDNLFIQHPIPQGDLGYAWITASAISAPLGYARDSRQYPTAADTITFLSASSFGLYDDGGDIYFGIDEVEAGLSGYPMFYNFDFVGLNIGLSEPIVSSTNTIGLDSSEDVAEYINRTVAISLGPYDDYRARVLNSINLNRNGPYGYPTFKQIRTGEHKVARDQRKNNRLDHITPARRTRVLGREIAIPPVKSTVIEPPLSSRFKPMSHTLRMETRIEEGESEEKEFILKHTYANNLTYFANKFLDDRLTKFDGSPLQNNIRQIYNEITDLYIRADMDDMRNPVSDFISLRYKETIYPREENTFLNRTRSRVNYDVAEILKWRSSRIDRASGSLTNSLGEPQTASLWPLDGRFDGTGFTSATTLRVDQVVAGAASPGLDNSGELLNTYTQFHNGTPANVKPSPLYARRDLYYSGSGEVFACGDANWQAAEQSGKYPFYDTYDDFSEEIKRYGKDYSIVPEFRISDHMEYFLNETELPDDPRGFRTIIDDLFKTEGASITSSADPSFIEGKGFYQVYSTSDFLKYFDILEADHSANEQIGGANSIRLTCKAIKKFRPREGFYPAQRTMQLATLFSKSFGKYTNLEGSDANFRTMMQPFFAPGIMYNSIKSGVAVDYPVYLQPYDKFVIDDSLSVGTAAWTQLALYSAGGYISTGYPPFYGRAANLGRYGSLNGSNKKEYVLSSSFQARVPFEAILDPSIISNAPIHDNEPHISASLNSTASFYGGPTINLYSLAAHNFTAEVASFYLKGGGFTSITSKSSRTPSFLTVEKVGNEYKEYSMDVILTAQLGQQTSVEVGSLFGGTTEYDIITKTIEMYDNPTAFGPICNSNSNSGSLEYEVGVLVGTPLHSITASYVDVTPFTPPYYNGFSRVRLTYKPTFDRTTLRGLLTNITASFYRGSIMNSGSSAVCATDAMQITASVNVFDPAKCMLTDKLVEFDELGNIISIKEDPDAGDRWVISTKFETPVLDFSNAERDIPSDGSEDRGVVPKGMWHQYGEIPTGEEQGIFLQIKNIPESEKDNINLTGSLADLVGFDNQQRTKKIGQLPDSKEVYEAIVAIPFLEGENGEQRFLPIPRQEVDASLLNLTNVLNVQARPVLNSPITPELPSANSVTNMVRKMQKYVFPPRFDFLTYSDIDPFAMYIFEFKHVFSKQDLADMWQNLSPASATSFQVAESAIQHDILARELISSDDINGMTASGKLRWMVFKVKQKGSKNYYEKTLANSDDDRFNVALPGRDDVVPEYSYNWPYDYFSLVELIKLEAEVEYTKKE